MKPKFSGPIQSPARMPHSGRHFQRSDGSDELTRLELDFHPIVGHFEASFHCGAVLFTRFVE